MPEHHSALPKIKTTDGRCSAHCPWCGAVMDEARIRLVDLVDCWEGDDPSFADRTPEGGAGSPLAVDCPECHRPSMIALGGAGLSVRDRRFVKVVPYRTPADVQLIREGAAS